MPIRHTRSESWKVSSTSGKLLDPDVYRQVRGTGVIRRWRAWNREFYWLKCRLTIDAGSRRDVKKMGKRKLGGLMKREKVLCSVSPWVCFHFADGGN